MSTTTHLNLPLQDNWTTDQVRDWAVQINDSATADCAFQILDNAVYARAIKPVSYTANHLISINTNGELLDAGMLSSDVVTLNGEQTISGIKTYTSNIIVPTPTANTHAATKAYVDTKQNPVFSATVVINPEDWSGSTCTKSVTGVTATNIVIVEPDSNNVQCTAQGEGTLTFTATIVPVVTVNVKVVIIP